MAKASLVAAKQANNLEALNARVTAIEAKLDQMLALLQASAVTKAPKLPKAKADDVIRN